MVHPSVPSMVFTPICPHSLSFRPIILPDSVTLKVTVPTDSRCPAWAAFDGQSRQKLDKGDSLIVKISRFPVPVICLNEESSDWFHTATTVLGWNMREKQKPFEEKNRNPR
jgi:NAD+ kinase